MGYDSIERKKFQGYRFFGSNSNFATESTEAGGTRNPKGHVNLLCNIGIISWNKNKKLKHCNTENTEKNRQSRNLRGKFEARSTKYETNWPPPPGAFGFRNSDFGFRISDFLFHSV
jgi:hypothetical protein